MIPRTSRCQVLGHTIPALDSRNMSVDMITFLPCQSNISSPETFLENIHRFSPGLALYLSEMEIPIRGMDCRWHETKHFRHFHNWIKPFLFIPNAHFPLPLNHWYGLRISFRLPHKEVCLRTETLRFYPELWVLFTYFRVRLIICSIYDPCNLWIYAR